MIRLIVPTPIAAFLMAALLIGTAQPVQAQFGGPSRVNQQRGATVGGIAGAVLGGIIGDNNGEAGAGAAIGGVVGAVAGGVLGNATDKEQQVVQQQRAYQSQQRQVYASQQQAVVNQGAISINDVVTMSRSGVSQSIIMNQINSRGIRSELQVPDIIAMHQQGVSEPVITAMQQAPVGNQVVARPAQTYQPVQTYQPAPVVHAPVIVQERYVVPHYGHPRGHSYHSAGRRQQIRIGF